MTGEMHQFRACALVAMLFVGCSGGETPEVEQPVDVNTPAARAPAKAERPAAKAPAAQQTKTATKTATQTAAAAGEPAESAPSVETAKPAVVSKSPALRNPDLAREKAPDLFKVRFETTKGTFVVEAMRSKAPHGVDRFYNLVNIGYFTDIACFRVVPRFVVQFGMHGDPDINAAWGGDNIPDDPNMQTNDRGYMTFASGGVETRSNQFFINLRNNSNLDSMANLGGFPPIARVVEGMSVVDQLFSGYGDMPSQGGRGPDPGKIERQGNDYLRRSFPKLDYIKSARIE